MKTAFLRAETIGLFRDGSDPDPSSADRDLSLEMALLSLWSYVAAVDGAIGNRTATAACGLMVAKRDLHPFEINRLQAHAGWLARHPASLADARRRFGAAKPCEIERVANTLLAMVHIDATMNPARIKALAKIYATLGLSEEQLHSDLHRISTGRQQLAQIVDGSPNPGFGIPKAPDPHAVSLDASRLVAVREQTDSVATLLHEVFAERDSPLGPTRPNRFSPGAGDPYVQFFQHICARVTWTMHDLAVLATELGLMANGAIETLNDRATALGLEPLLDCDDEVCDLHEPTMKEFLAHG